MTDHGKSCSTCDPAVPAVPRAHSPSTEHDARDFTEEAAFFDSPNGQIYYVQAVPSAPPRGLVLSCGGFGAERNRGYGTLANWTRSLATHGFHAVRFDYRGIGESAGRFEEMTLSAWRDDAEYCAARLRDRYDGVPIILHGVRGGALIAGELFNRGLASAALFWSPPAGGRELLWDTMRRTLVAQMLADPGSPRTTREELFAELEAGRLVNVDGYFWSRDLWLDAQEHHPSLPSAAEHRPWRVIHVEAKGNARKTPLNAHHEFVTSEIFWEQSRLLVSKCETLFRASLSWLDETFPNGRP